MGCPLLFSITRPERVDGVGICNSTLLAGAVTATGALFIGGLVLGVEAEIDRGPAASPFSEKVPSGPDVALREVLLRADTIAPLTGVPSLTATPPLTSTPRSTVIVSGEERAVSN